MASFVDTNILIYAEDRDAKDKHLVARDLIVELWDSREGVLSVQILQEFYVNVTRKLKKPLSASKAREIVEEYRPEHPMPYGDLVKQKVQRYSSIEDLKKVQIYSRGNGRVRTCILSWEQLFIPVLITRQFCRKQKKKLMLLFGMAETMICHFTNLILQSLLLIHIELGMKLSYYPGAVNIHLADVVIINKIDTHLE